MVLMKIIFLLFAFIFFGSPVLGKEAANSSDIISLVKELKSVDPAEFDKSVDLIAHYRFMITDNLKRILSEDLSDEKKANICYLLGEFRDTSSISQLSKNIKLNLIIPKKKVKGIPKWFAYPCQEALSKIGKYTYRQMLENLAVSNDEKVRELSANVILGVERGDRDLALLVLDKAIEKAEGDRRARLEQAKKYFEIKRPSTE